VNSARAVRGAGRRELDATDIALDENVGDVEFMGGDL